MKNIFIFIIISFQFILSSCDKNKIHSNRFSGESWAVKSLTINGESNSDLPTLAFSDCSIYKENCTGTWSLENSTSNFVWQFRDKAKTFEISNQSEITTHLEEAILQCMNLSGIYDVESSSKTKITISSTSTIGYEGVNVNMELEKI